MSNHTPGPWHWTDHIGPYITIYADKDDRKILKISEPFYRDSKGEAVANANLIAAAPDLLAACKAIVEHDYFADSAMMRKRIDAMKVAISKAEKGE